MTRPLTALVLALLLSGCTASPAAPAPKQYSASFLTLFDTVTTVVGRAPDEQTFRQTAQAIHDRLLVYHRLFDIYHEYDGICNLKTVNDRAGIAPVKVDRAIIDLLLDCRAYYEATAGRVNVAMGSVLALWHRARTEGLSDPLHASLPDPEELVRAAAHTDLNAVWIDEAASTVYLTDPALRLDVGAVAKGWAAQQVAQTAPAGLLISVGGNVCATGPKDAAGTPWVVGVRDPRGGPQDYLHTLSITRGSVVTSGDYQRAYTVDGVSYHHIIDPDTLSPGTGWSSVTVVCADSGLADALSTALFLLSRGEGQALLDQYGAQALWVDREGGLYASPGFSRLIT